MFSLPLASTRAVVIVALVAFLTGCASTYKPVAFESLDYTGAQSAGALDVAYRYEAQPGYYGKKARKRGYDVIAVRVTNTTDAPVNLSPSALRIQAAGAPVSPLRPEIVADNIRQPIWTYLLWNLANVTIFDEEGDIVAFVPIGLGISVLNMLQSSFANGKVENAYAEQNLMGKTVPPGQTVEGLLFLSTTGFAPLTFEYVGAPMSAPAEPATVGGQ